MATRFLKIALLIAGAAGAPLPSGPSAAQAIRDDFVEPEVSRRNWLVCERGENEFSLLKAPGQSFRALKAVVHPRRDLAVFGLQSGHAGCANEAGEYLSGEDERAELWETDAIQLKLGTEVWYQFSMFIDPGIRASHRRLVIGQWKQSGRNSPIIAQRFNGRAFTITIEQDNRAEDRDPRDTQCRVVIAVDAAAARPPGSSNPHFRRLPGMTALNTSLVGAPSLGHDAFEVVHGPQISAPTLAGAAGCMRDLAVERLGTLPASFGRWTQMRYHIKATADAGGLLEVWADGQPIARVTGRFGFEAGRDTARQYFKFGPYRDHEAYQVHAMLARFRRGASPADLE